MDDLSEVSGFGDYSENTDMGDYPQYPDKDTEQMAQGVILGDKINFWVNGVLNMPISVLGIIGNIICIGTLVKHHQSLKFKPAFTKLLVLLSLCYIFSLVKVKKEDKLLFKGVRHRSSWSTRALDRLENGKHLHHLIGQQLPLGQNCPHWQLPHIVVDRI